MTKNAFLRLKKDKIKKSKESGPKLFFPSTLTAPNNLKAYLIKWTTFGEPQVGSISTWKSYFRSNKVFTFGPLI